MMKEMEEHHETKGERTEKDWQELEQMTKETELEGESAIRCVNSHLDQKSKVKHYKLSSTGEKIFQQQAQ